MNAIRMMLAQGRMAAPVAAQGEADVSFVWDGVLFEIGEYVSQADLFTVTVTLLKDRQH